MKRCKVDKCCNNRNNICIGEWCSRAEKDKIICLVGESGSGKTTVAKALEKEGYNIIHSYTTRPPREEDEWGHIFVDQKEWIATVGQKQDQMIAYTFYNGHHYWATKEQYQDKGITIYVIDVPGVKALKEKVKDAEIVAIYLKSDPSTRVLRMLPTRGSDAAYKRIEHDREAFKLVQCDYVVDTNRSIEEVVEMVKEVLCIS